MKKFLSILISSILFFCNSVFAGGEDKIVYVENGEKYIFVSTDNIPKLVDLFQNKLSEQEGKRFSRLGNCVYKTLVIGAGIAICVGLCYGASKIDDKDISKITSISAGVLTILGTFAVSLVPEYINRKVDRFINLTGGNCIEWQGYSIIRDGKFESQTGEYAIDNPPNDFRRLVCNLERISSEERHRIKHNKEVKYDFDTLFDPCFSDNNEGIIIYVIKRSSEIFEKAKSDNYFKPFDFVISRQSEKDLQHDYTYEGFGVLSATSQSTMDICNNRTLLKTREERIYKFDNELFNKIFE